MSAGFLICRCEVFPRRTPLWPPRKIGLAIRGVPISPWDQSWDQTCPSRTESGLTRSSCEVTDSADFQAVSPTAHWRRVASHARGRWFDPSRAHPPKSPQSRLISHVGQAEARARDGPRFDVGPFVGPIASPGDPAVRVSKPAATAVGPGIGPTSMRRCPSPRRRRRCVRRARPSLRLRTRPRRPISVPRTDFGGAPSRGSATRPAEAISVAGRDDMAAVTRPLRAPRAPVSSENGAIARWPGARQVRSRLMRGGTGGP